MHTDNLGPASKLYIENLIKVIGRMVASVGQRDPRRQKLLSLACRAFLDGHLIQSIQMSIFQSVSYFHHNVTEGKETSY